MLRLKNNLCTAQTGTRSVPCDWAAPVHLPNVIEHDNGRGIYRAVVPLAGCGRTCTAIIDHHRQHIGLAVRLGYGGPPAVGPLITMARIQARASLGLSRLDYDSEDGSVWLRAGSVLTADADANLLFSFLLADAGIILADDRLETVVNGWATRPHEFTRGR